jgi:mono/diheme cytochrome c family protein
MRLLWLSLVAVGALAQDSPRDFKEAQAFLARYCGACHGGKTPAGGFSLERVKEPASFLGETHSWQRLTARIEMGDMPPKSAPAPKEAEREAFLAWSKDALHREACAAGLRVGPRPLRRLNRAEYTATVQHLFDIHLDIGASLPVDGAGGEGFDNAAETLFLSPLHAEKYLETAKLATDFAAKEYKSRTRILIAKPGPGLTPHQAARKILAAFLPKAFRRPVTEADLAPYLTLFSHSLARGDAFEPSIFYTLRAVLVSPHFLFRAETGPYALASRLSYFLWGSLPNELLFDLAKRRELSNPEVLRALIPRMLRDDRSHNFLKRFIEQWLHTRDLEGDKAPDAKLFPEYAADEDLRGDIRLQPVYFFRELLNRNLPITHLLDSEGTIATSNLEKHFGLKLPLNRNAAKQPQWVELPKNSGRGGVLGMPAVLAVSSYPYRTSPVLRGAFILDAILGTPPPAPPPNVPPLEESPPGAAPKSIRERLAQHRVNQACASCHSRIDPLGFALENFDSLGRWRDTEGGKPIDVSAEMPDGQKFAGPQELRAVLLSKQDLFVRNLTSKLLGYALGRGLNLYDSCTIDAIVAEVKNNGYSSQRLIEAIVLSPPFLAEGAP